MTSRNSDYSPNYGELTIVRPVPLGILTAAGLFAATQDNVLFGFSLTETTGLNAAEVQIINGADARGAVIYDVTLAAGQSTREHLAPFGVAFDSGVVFNCVSGSVRCTALFGPI